MTWYFRFLFWLQVRPLLTSSCIDSDGLGEELHVVRGVTINSQNGALKTRSGKKRTDLQVKTRNANIMSHIDYYITKEIPVRKQFYSLPKVELSFQHISGSNNYRYICQEVITPIFYTNQYTFWKGFIKKQNLLNDLFKKGFAS